MPEPHARFSAEDATLLARAAAFPSVTLADLTPPALARIAADHGTDLATALLYDRLTRTEPHASLLRRLDELMADPPRDEGPVDALVAVVPGAFYRELPQAGGDGRLLRERVQALGFRTAVVPTRSMGTATENGTILCDWLRERDEPVILASISKGAADVKAALARPDAADAFRSVRAWLSISGMANGTPVANRMRRSLTGLLFRAFFWWKGLDFAVNRELEWGPGTPLDFPFSAPPHLRMIHVVGFPLAHHWTSGFLRRLSNGIAYLGPNDGFLVLADSCALPGVIYPVWGADHNLRPAWNVRPLIGALAHHLAESLDLRTPAAVEPAAP